jgi:hypothetical protein
MASPCDRARGPGPRRMGEAMLLSKCGLCGRTVRADAATCPSCHAATGAGKRPAPQEVGYWIAMLATGCAVLFWLLVIRG